MPAVAKLSHYPQSPRKVRLVANLLKGKPVDVAFTEAKTLDKRAAPVLEKLLHSAVANAKTQGLDVASLFIKEFRVDKGLVMRRIMPRAMGRAFPILRRTSHVTVVLEERAGEVSGEKTRIRKRSGAAWSAEQRSETKMEKMEKEKQSTPAKRAMKKNTTT